MIRTASGAVFALLFFVALSQAPARSAQAFDSEYLFESAFLGNLQPGDTGTLSVFFANTGTTTWAFGTVAQVNLAVCLADKVTCGVAASNSSWNPGTWLSSSAYATHTKTVVTPGDFSAFSYAVRVPANASVGSYRFNGDLVVAATGTRLHPQGYYQDATVTSTTPAITAPSDVQVSVAELDNGPKADDVRVLFTAPATNPLLSYDVQRISGSCPVAPDHVSWLTVQSLVVVGGVASGYTDYDRIPGTYCYQVRVKNAAGAYVYSNQRLATVFGTAASSDLPISTSAVLTNNTSNIPDLDAGDVFVVTFSKDMVLSPGARIRFQDADCGAPASQSSGPASCVPPSAQTISDVICATNASCLLSFDLRRLTVTMSGSPMEVQSGSAPGTQLPAVIISSTGIADTQGNIWSVGTSSDRVIGPLGQ